MRSGRVVGRYPNRRISSPCLLGRIVTLHADYFAREWSLAEAFETMVAAGLADFLSRRDPAQDGFWTA